MSGDDQNGRVEELRATAALARTRFSALQEAFKAVEFAHARGDYSPSAEFKRRLEEFHQTASEVHRLATELRSKAGSPGEADRIT